MIKVMLRIENTYADGVEETTITTAEVDDYPHGQDQEVVDEWWLDNIFDHTGTGRTEDVDALYEVLITESDDERLIGERYEF